MELELQEESGVTAKEIWDTLSKINVNEHTMEKNNLSYLSWAWAWGIMMEHYPEMKFRFTEFGMPGEAEGVSSACYHNDGTASVEVTVQIGSVSRVMFLPVMTGFKNTAVMNPDARDIGDAKMRCLTKCFALFGLGHYIYAGEDVPSGGEPAHGMKEEKTEDLSAVAIVFDEFLKNCTTEEEVNIYWKDNTDTLKKLLADNNDTYTQVREAFKLRKAEIREGTP